MSPGGSLLLPSQGISSGYPGCSDAFSKPCPSKQPTVYSQGVVVWIPQGPILGANEGQKVPPQPLLSRLGFVGRSGVLLEDPFLTIEDGHVKMFHNS